MPARPALARNVCRRFFASEVGGIEASAENSLKQLHSIEAQINTQLTPEDPVPSLDVSHHTAPEVVPVAEQYQLYQQQSEQATLSGRRTSDTT